jgi:DNA polymerase III epsilon subunit-like protein
MDQRFVFLDLETGGLSPKHPIIQFAAVAVDDTLTELESLEAKIRFSEQTATQASLRKTHYSRARWAREAVEPRDAAWLLADFLRRHATSEYLREDGTIGQTALLAGHNADAFDGPFLHAWYRTVGLYCPAHRRALCTMQRAMWYFAEHPELPRPDNMKLLTLCRYFNVPLHPTAAHDALADVRATVGLYCAIREAEAKWFATTPPLHSRPDRRASRFAAAS